MPGDQVGQATGVGVERGQHRRGVAVPGGTVGDDVGVGVLGENVQVAFPGSARATDRGQGHGRRRPGLHVVSHGVEQRNEGVVVVDRVVVGVAAHLVVGFDDGADEQGRRGHGLWWQELPYRSSAAGVIPAMSRACCRVSPYANLLARICPSKLASTEQRCWRSAR